MTKPKPKHLLQKVGRKPLPPELLHRWTLDELMRRCQADSVDECWDYHNHKGQQPDSDHARRYPSVDHGGEKVLVRRLAFRLAFGEDVPPGRKLVPTCRNQYCQNPYHCKPMTESQKSRVAAKSGKYSTLLRRAKVAAAKRANSKLGGMEVAERIRAENIPWSEQPWKKYNISESMYKRIKSNRAWINFAASNNAISRMVA